MTRALLPVLLLLAGCGASGQSEAPDSGPDALRTQAIGELEAAAAEAAAIVEADALADAPTAAALAEPAAGGTGTPTDATTDAER